MTTGTRDVPRLSESTPPPPRAYNVVVMSRPSHAAARLALAATCALVLIASPSEAQPPPSAGVVKTVAGSAILVRSGQELAISAGQTVAEGDTIRTGAGSRVGITLKDGTRLALGANTELRLDTFAYAPAQKRLGIVLRLLRGVTEYISGRIAQLSPGAVKVETPTSVIGIRGTRLLIGVDQP